MKNDIILAGVGGQGILSIAAIIGYAAVQSNLYLKQAEVHGMSQRGGDVQSHLRLSSEEIASDLIPEGKADMIISVEPMESLRYVNYLGADGWLITNTEPYVNIPDYPDMEDVMAEIRKQPRHVAINADKIADEAGSKKAANVAILGAASPFLDMPFEKLEDAIRFLFGKKGEDLVEVNLKALRAGREFAKKKGAVSPGH